MPTGFFLDSVSSSRSYLFKFRLLVIVVLLLGILFRFINIDHKIYWRDEALTSLQVAGYTQAEFVQQVFNGQILSPEYLQKYQQLNSEKTLGDTITALATETPEHPPFYYIMLRFWMQHAGTSVAVIRSLSVFISLLVFPCIYWLCLELFESPLVGGVAVALIAVSPFHVVYAQEAREYSLWTVTTLLSGAALLKALRVKTWVSWGIYSVTVALGLYSHVFFAFVLLGHSVYVFASSSFRLSKILISYMLVSVVGFLTFLPWIWTIISHLPEVHRSMYWTKVQASLPDLVKTWFSNLRLIFFDLEIPRFRIPFFSLFYFIVLCIAVLSGYSIYFLYSKTEKKVWLFVLTLIGITPLPLILPDLISGGIRSTTPRYFIPFYLGIQLSVAHLFATQTSSGKIPQQRTIWRIIMAIVISGGVISCVSSSQAQVWWNKSPINNNIELTHFINQASRPLLISNNYANNHNEILSLTYLLDPKVRIQLVKFPDLPNIPNGFSDVFFYNPSGLAQEWQEKLQRKYKVEAVKQFQNLWLLEK
ncbi:MAG TPA: glycosyltransferase family 39 protein [Coleofasciculaceae cyanobacterium]|jgi:uncharacterized membrane protein